MNCIYCQKEINNKGSLISHQMCCKLNPNSIPHKHSTNAGAQKGKPNWSKGKILVSEEESIRRNHEIVLTKLHLYSEVAARRHVKKYLIHILGNICSICETKEWQGKLVPLVCDHVSGDSTDNRLENFRLVCCNCDAQLPTYKSKNKGRGRKYDRDYKRNK